jgi:hypothetical protein
MVVVALSFNERNFQLVDGNKIGRKNEAYSSIRVELK